MRRERMFPEGSCALVMVSGGQDSLALLHLLASGAVRRVGPASLHALHVNHHLRGPESDDDEALVVRACGALDVDLTVFHRPVRKERGNVQETARDARREAALRVAAERGCDRIVLGHTVDDQVETMLYRLGRYGGLGAFAGMRACDPPWVRPLLGCRRQETAAYCREHGLVHAEDRGNAYPGYARTAIRERVLPAWEAALPGAVDAAARAAEVAAELRELAADVLDAAAGGVIAERPRTAEADGPDAPPGLSAAALLALTPPVRRLLLHRWLEGHAAVAASRASVLAVEALLEVRGSAARALGGGFRACKEYDVVFLERAARGAPRGRTPEPSPVPVPLAVPGRAAWDDVVIEAEYAERFEMPDVRREAYLDAAALDGPLTVRGPLPGDRLRPLGAAGTRKLQDILVDARVPARDRARRPLVVCGERIVWVCGLVIAEECRITRDTTSLIRLTVSPGGGPGRSGGGRSGGEEWTSGSS
jgi:tRNA(Ile)-lysidine synthase